ncbi:MAG TPA: ATP-binding protein [Oligoflexus sp.]|uniref:ATP-binding protein n=1 Tax=Oligoflexus sp. TaxID=1971216 RepID=UPI002D80FCA1|nr:ATP-binding protein [Oligoflexus sp.]HET9240347.1 ATP-binding protein [Oligoflexus sp.]
MEKSSELNLSDESAQEVAVLQQRLQEAEELLHAIQAGEVDALVVNTEDGEKIFTLSGADEVYRVFLNSMEQGAVVLGLAGMITYCNSSFAGLLGLPIQTIMGKDLEGFVCESDRDSYRELSLKASVTPSSAELGLKGPAGDRIDTLVSFNSMPTSQRALICLIITDLRPQKKNLEALRESREWFQILADSMPHIVWTTDARGHATYFNRRWYEFNGRVPEKDSENDCDMAAIIHSNDLPSYDTLWTSLVHDPRPFHMECRLLAAASKLYRWHLIQGLPVTSRRGGALQWICTGTDIHEQKCIEQELARSNDELAQFAFVASHDLQEPLRKIMNYVGVFTARYRDLVDESGRRYLDQIVEGSRRMRDLIQGLLNLSRVGHENLESQTLDMSMILDDVLNDQAASISSAAAHLNVQALPKVKMPRSELYQIFSNVIANAVKFRREDVPLQISVYAVKSNEGDLDLTVQDNGIGIESQYLEQVFVPFKRLHTQTKYPGAGLGLAICRKIMERHGGRMRMESVVGLGSWVHVLFPAQMVLWNAQQ